MDILTQECVKFFPPWGGGERNQRPKRRGRERKRNGKREEIKEGKGKGIGKIERERAFPFKMEREI